MKKLLTLLVLISAGYFQQVNAQINNYYVYGDSLIGCQNTLSGYVNTGANADDGYVLVSWGDGSSNNFVLNISANSYSYYELSHTYAVPGTYNADIQFYSNALGGFYGTGEQVELYAMSQSSCGYFYSYVIQSNPYINYWEAPLDCTGADGTTTTISSGMYNYGSYSGLDPANAPYTVSVNDAWLTTNGYIQSSPDVQITSFASNGMANPSQITFTVTCNVPAQNPDFNIQYVWPSNFVAPLQTGNLYMYICNDACSDTSDVTLSVNFPSGFVPNTTGLTNAVVNGTNLTFDILGLSNCMQLLIPFTFPGNTPAGTSICFDVTAINPLDSYLPNNSDSICGWVLNSYDPNAKEVDHAQQIDPNVQETLEYMVHFQNDGNFNAVNVEVIDTISTNLDLSTFKLIGSKHGVAVHIDPATRIVKFMFNNIYLAPSSQDLDASQGYVIYSLEEVAGLQEGDEIDNTAYIYFDYNSPIVTNTAYNVNSTLGLKPTIETKITLYPNPTSTKFQVLGSDLQEIQVIDLSGKVVQTSKLTNTNIVDVENLSNGIYTCVITSANGTYQEKLVIKK